MELGMMLGGVETKSGCPRNGNEAAIWSIDNLLDVSGGWDVLYCFR